MNRADCAALLRWVLPRMQLRWPGYRKVGRQVCRRIQRRIESLKLPDLQAYRDYLQQHPEEWRVLDQLTPITISSFYRDTEVWTFLGEEVLGRLESGGNRTLRAWSIGCASGEEAFTLMLLWHLCVAPSRPGIDMCVLATDVHEPVLERARAGCYSYGSVKHLPAGWLNQAFEPRGDGYCLRPAYRSGIEFRREDIRTTLPDGNFDLLLCRNLVFTYFDETLQRGILERMLSRLQRGGALVVGLRESMPAGDWGLTAWPGAESLGIYRKAD